MELYLKCEAFNKGCSLKDYRTHIINSKNGEKDFYEDVLQWGKQEDFIEHPEWLEKIDLRLGQMVQSLNVIRDRKNCFILKSN